MDRSILSSLLLLAACATSGSGPGTSASEESSSPGSMPEWVWEQTHAKESTLVGWGTSDGAAKSEAAGLGLHLIDRAGINLGDIGFTAASGDVRSALAEAVALKATWTSPDGRSFARGELELDSMLAFLRARSKWTPEHERTLRGAFPAFCEEHRAGGRQPPVWGSDGGYLFGVGVAKGIKNFSLGRVTADNRGRAEVAKLFEAFTAAAMKDFTQPVEVEPCSECAVASAAIRSFAAQTLNGVEIDRRWYDVENNVHYSLAVLYVDPMTENWRRAGLDERQVQRLAAELRRVISETSEADRR